MGTWSIEHIKSSLPQSTWESFVNHNVVAGMMIGVLVVSLSYPLAHKIYQSKSETYRNELSRDQQLVVVQHTIEAFFLSLIFAPLTYIMLSLNFEEQAAESFKRKVSTLAVLMFVVIIMYLIELASRYQALRPLVVVHHLCAYVDSIIPAFFLTTANIKASSILVYFISYEAITFVGLIMYRLCPSHKMTRPVILSGMVVFGLSRPLQLVWILASMIVLWDELILWQAIFQVVLAVLFTTLQMYSLSIHYSLYQKCGRMKSTFTDYHTNDSRGERDASHLEGSSHGQQSNMYLKDENPDDEIASC